MPITSHDLVLEMFADDERLLLELLACVEDDVVIYRELAQEAIHALHRELSAHAATRQQLARLQDEYRHLRAQVMKNQSGGVLLLDAMFHRGGTSAA